jgi:DNA repair exonuclease SbcCD ATPase subunit
MIDSEWPNRKPYEIADENIQEIHRLRNALSQSIETVKDLQSQLAAANEENFKFRQALWLLNGDVGKYGDDGEMQSLGVDYKRGDADRIIRTTTKEIQKTTVKLTAANARLEEAEKVIDSLINAKPDWNPLSHPSNWVGLSTTNTAIRNAEKWLESYQSQKGGKG